MLTEVIYQEGTETVLPQALKVPVYSDCMNSAEVRLAKLFPEVWRPWAVSSSLAHPWRFLLALH